MYFNDITNYFIPLPLSIAFPLRDLSFSFILNNLNFHCYLHFVLPKGLFGIFSYFHVPGIVCSTCHKQQQRYDQN